MLKKLLISLFFFSMLSLRAFGEMQDEHWISYTNYNYISGAAGPKYLMKIDSVGNVIIPAVKVVPESGYQSPPYGATALSQTDRLIVMWIPDARRDPQTLPIYPVYRAVIQKRNLELVSLGKTRIRVYNSYALQVTQRNRDNFLVFEELDDILGVRYAGIPLSPLGRLLSGRLSPFPGPVSCPCEMGISADGRIFFFTDGVDQGQKFTIQRLNLDGEPFGKSIIVAKGYVGPADVSNKIPGHRRFVLYHRLHTRDVLESTLHLQVLSANTLEKIGDPIRIATRTGFGVQTATIDPLGHFVLYTTGTGNPVGEAILMFQALDALGHPSGAPKVIAKGVNSGLDVLQDHSVQ